MLAKSQWQDLIPHRGAMSLLDRVIDWTDTEIHLTASSHRDPTNPLRSDDMLRAVHLCEYGAQAMAVHGGLIAQAAGTVASPGFLVSLRGIELFVARIDGLPEDLHVYAQKSSADDSSLLYIFRIEHAGQRIGEGRAMVSLTSVANDVRRSAIRGEVSRKE
jgi:predicted hotdog family 3-hydroxylacyl-ACP dehydratase